MKQNDDYYYHLRYNVGHTIAKNLPINIPWVAPDIAQILLYPEVKKVIKKWMDYEENNS